MQKIELPQVTLCCVDTTGRIPTSLLSMAHCLKDIQFGDAILLTLPELLLDQTVPDGLRVIAIEPLTSIEAYSRFMVKSLSQYVQTSHCLIVQWDGYVLNALRWKDDFLRFDYIGAPWTDRDGTRTVGNGGFSLRSKKLLDVLAEDSTIFQHPEDACICRLNRKSLEDRGIQFASVACADAFAVEDMPLNDQVFGFHGPQHLPKVLGPEAMVGFIRSFSPEKLLYSNLFDMLLRELTLSAQQDPAFQPALDALVTLIQRALNEFGSSATSSEYSLVICKALVRYGQYDSADLLLNYRLQRSGFSWTNVKLLMRLKIYRFLKTVRFRH